MKARPANTHQTSGATAKSTAPTKDAPRPSNIAARRPIWSEMPPKPTNMATTAIGYTAKINATWVAGGSVRDEERCRLQDLVFNVDKRVFFQCDAPIGQPLGIRFHRVAPPLPVRQILVLPEVYDPAHGSDMGDEEAVGL